MLLQREHPGWAWSRCDVCREYVLDGKTGEPIKNGRGDMERRPIPPNCSQCPKHKAIGGDPLDWSVSTYLEWLTCKRLGCLPEPGGLMDQDARTVRAWQALSFMEECERQGIMQAAPMMALGI